MLYSTRDYFFRPQGRFLSNEIFFSQVYFTGNLAVSTITSVAFVLGGITVIQLFGQLSRVGGLELMGTILNIVIIRELGPMITAFVVIARSGSAIAAEIATMMVNDEVSAIEMQGISILKYVVFPRIAGVTIALVMLTIYFNAMGLIGGYFVGKLFAGITFATFQTYIINSIGLIDIFSSILKSILFGLFISSISIYYGFQAFSTTQIPQQTTKAVVSSIFFLFLIDIIVTSVMVV